MLLVSSDLLNRNLGDRVTVGDLHVIAAIVIDIQVAGAQFLGPVVGICLPCRSLFQSLADVDSSPAKESIALAFQWRGDVHAFVDSQRLILGIGVIAIVLVPIDMGRGGSLGVDIERLQLHRVLHGVAVGLGRYLLGLGQFLTDHEGLVVEDLDGGIHISRAVPPLHYPVGELLAGRSHDVGLVRSQSTGAIDIDVGF